MNQEIKLKVLNTLNIEESLHMTEDDIEEAISNEDWIILEDEEADIMAREQIESSLWAFNYSFLVKHSNVIAKIPEDIFKIMVERMCEDANEIVLALIDNLNDFIEDTINTDGRGHFIASYDFIEYEVEIDIDDSKKVYYAYRLN